MARFQKDQPVILVAAKFEMKWWYDLASIKLKLFLIPYLLTLNYGTSRETWVATSQVNLSNDPRGVYVLDSFGCPKQSLYRPTHSRYAHDTQDQSMYFQADRGINPHLVSYRCILKSQTLVTCESSQARSNPALLSHAIPCQAGLYDVNLEGRDIVYRVIGAEPARPIHVFARPVCPHYHHQQSRLEPKDFVQICLMSPRRWASPPTLYNLG